MNYKRLSDAKQYWIGAMRQGGDLRGANKQRRKRYGA